MPGDPLFLHIGLQKTGTSYLQSIFWQSQDALREQGLDMVPRSKRDTFWLMLRVRGRYNAEFDPPAVAAALDRLPAALARATSGRALISEESLAPADRGQIRELLEACAGREVHVVVTVRDLARQIPSAWQQTLQGGGSETFPDYLDRLRANEGKPNGRLWRNKDVAAVLERWREFVPPERIHVVTVPPSGSDPELLLERFCSVLGVDAAKLDREVAKSNSALRHVHAEVLRRVNANLDRSHRRRDVYGDIGKRYLAVRVLGDGGGEKVKMPRSLEPWCTAVSRRYVDHIAEGGYDVVGDLADLLPTGSAFADRSPEPSGDEVADAASAALATVLTGQMDRLRSRRAAAQAAPARASLPRRAARRARRLLQRS
ncbi:hypothetical protein [Nocardioides panaciterrulae]|uniref:Sulfotransferase family protein n=1 Tax=Nocardioides panaciterrulae TaxID=661492 RepID=A0A7Y9E4C4_9ACTN|nr:hypothetical protein [Nocardioides panaciterrulae]NYD40978.1 hypothetical protein [Nocardioides panaciterrulae]